MSRGARDSPLHVLRKAHSKAYPVPFPEHIYIHTHEALSRVYYSESPGLVIPALCDFDQVQGRRLRLH